MPDGVTVARLPLEEKIGVRIPVRQQIENLGALRLRFSSSRTNVRDTAYDIFRLYFGMCG